MCVINTGILLETEIQLKPNPIGKLIFFAPSFPAKSIIWRKRVGIMESATTLLQRDVIVTVIEPQKPQEQRNLTFQLSLRSAATPHKAAVETLHLTITDELNPFFLYVLSLDADEFFAIKQEKSIEPDFSEFPNHLVRMIEACTAAEMRAVRFMELHKVHQDATLLFFTRDEFSKVTRLELRMRGATEDGLKRHLARNLEDCKVVTIDM